MNVLAPYLRCILAPNPGPMTLEGTNTWILGDPDQAPAVVVDPGPDAPAHLDAILQACHGRIATILLTHRHADHAEGAASLAERARCGVRAADPALVRGTEGLREGDVLRLGGARIQVAATPGHTSDSHSMLLIADDGVNRLLTGDMVLGRGTTVITYPDGDLAAYFASLARMERLIDDHAVSEVLPGHGPVVADPSAGSASIGGIARSGWSRYAPHSRGRPHPGGGGRPRVRRRRPEPVAGRSAVRASPTRLPSARATGGVKATEMLRTL